jgi:hypothetical protein
MSTHHHSNDSMRLLDQRIPLSRRIEMARGLCESPQEKAVPTYVLALAEEDWHLDDRFGPLRDRGKPCPAVTPDDRRGMERRIIDAACRKAPSGGGPDPRRWLAAVASNDRIKPVIRAQAARVLKDHGHALPDHSPSLLSGVPRTQAELRLLGDDELVSMYYRARMAVYPTHPVVVVPQPVASPEAWARKVHRKLTEQGEAGYP